MIKLIKYQCPVCKNYTLSMKNEYDICTVCGWEDDGYEKYPDEESGPNHISFNEAKRLWDSNIGFNNDCIFIRKPLGIEMPKGSKEYLDIKKYIDDPENSYKEANKALDYEISHGTFDNIDYLEAKNKAFTIFNALAFLDSEIGRQSAIRLALCYANGYGCKRNLYVASRLAIEVEELYNARLKNVSIKHINGLDVDSELITIRICDKTNPKYLKVITDLLSKKLDSSKYEVVSCDVVGDNSISVKVNDVKHQNIDLLKDIKNILINFTKIKTTIVDTKAFKNPHEGIAYFNGAQELIRNYF